MPFVADLHIHSRFSRATSKQLNPENLHLWSALKGITVVGTGDFTHPEWLAELKEKLVPDEPGLYRLRDTCVRSVAEELPDACRRDVRFMLTVEISLIYKKDEKTRKVHHVVMLPDFDAVDRLNARLNEIGNLKSDGRPILGLDSRDLVEICVEACEDVLFLPAHIWTPHFAVLGASSGFETLEHCFEDMLPHIFAVETGLSSDPPMNWRLSMLDDYAIVSNSDAHSPQKLGREATVFDGPPSFHGVYDALKTRDPERFLGTIEFYPEEGKYHYDGHRKCDVCWTPSQTLEADGVCPVCGKKLTVGVLHRVELLADRSEGCASPNARRYESVIPLPEVIGSVLGVGANSKKVQTVYRRMLTEIGPELEILRETSAEEIAAAGEPMVAEAIRRARSGEVDLSPGFDGVYGTVRVFTDAERGSLPGQGSLFDVEPKAPDPGRPEARARDLRDAQTTSGEAFDAGSGEAVADDVRMPAGEIVHGGLDGAQREAVKAVAGPVVVVAGPGTGKTRVLTHRIADLVQNRGVKPGNILALTFTNKAAEEMRSRVTGLLSDAADVEQVMIGTFHRAALHLLRMDTPDAVLPLIDAEESRQILKEVVTAAGGTLRIGAVEEALSLARAAGVLPADPEIAQVLADYRAVLDGYRVMDFDTILELFRASVVERPELLDAYRARFQHVLVDEFQDINRLQYDIVRLLAGDGTGLFVIGDPDQSIYGFRGASPTFFSELEGHFPDTRTVSLNRTYRSPRQVIGAGLHVLGRPDDALLAVKPDGPRIRFLHVPSATSEGIAVAHEIRRLAGGLDMLQSHGEEATDGAGLGFGDVAVLFRTGRQADAIETCLDYEGIPYRVVGQRSFLESDSVRAALAFLRYVDEPDSPYQMMRVLSLPQFTPGREALARLRREAFLAGFSPNGELDKLRAARTRFADVVAGGSAIDMVRAWRETFGKEGDPDLQKLEGQAEAAGSLRALLDGLRLGLPAETERVGRTRRPEAVSLMTLHASKGLEFPVVFICGAEEGLIPYIAHVNDAPRAVDRQDWAVRADEALDEERRLLYVGMTRAKERLIFTCARRRMRFGEHENREASRFLARLGPEWMERETVTPRMPGRRGQMSLF